MMQRVWRVAKKCHVKDLLVNSKLMIAVIPYSVFSSLIFRGYFSSLIFLAVLRSKKNIFLAVIP